MMSGADGETADKSCASCGIAEVDDIKLKTCPGCDLVRYCSDQCQEDHRLQHERECEDRVKELRDEILFRQPESRDLGECPICLLPLPIHPQKSEFMGCCSKTICYGCNYTNKVREIEAKLKQRCPFCRHRAPKSYDEFAQSLMKRIEVKDPSAMRVKATRCFCEGDIDRALEYYNVAAELGNMEAHYQLSELYHVGEGVEKDVKKYLYHTEEAAIGGHPDARYALGWVEMNNGSDERAVKHWIIAANLGCDRSVKMLKNVYAKGCIPKDDFAAALRAHQAAVDATQSPHREEAEAFRAAQQQLSRQNQR
jgi:hypothetical protein